MFQTLRDLSDHITLCWLSSWLTLEAENGPARAWAHDSSRPVVLKEKSQGASEISLPYKEVCIRRHCLSPLFCFLSLAVIVCKCDAWSYDNHLVTIR